MNHHLRKIVASTTLAVGLLGGSAAVANAATSSSTAATSSAAAATNSTPMKPPGAAERSTALAKQLGVSLDKVTKAEAAARAAVDAKYGQPDRTKPPSTNGPTAAQQAAMKARHTLFETTFATKLGVSTDTLRSAMAAVEREHLATEVAAGHLTQAQADAILKAIANGERPAGPGGPGGHRPGLDGHGPGGPGGHGPGLGAPPTGTANG